jgi:cobalt-zinc-cadmium efflux system outer membrane protein
MTFRIATTPGDGLRVRDQRVRHVRRPCARLALAGLLICSRLSGAQATDARGSDTRASRDAELVHVASPSTSDPQLDALIAEALERSPLTSAAADRIAAAQARIRPAGTRTDPRLTSAVSESPMRTRGATGFAMLTAGISQAFPWPGKLALRTRAAELDAVAARTMLDAARLGVVRAVKDAYYDLAYLSEALAIAKRNQTVLVEIVRVTEALYSTGTGGQQDVLKARVETARLAETASVLEEARRAALAQLNAARDRESDTPVGTAMIPARVAHAAIAADVATVHFTAQTLGARVADSPFPLLATLQDEAIRSSPVLREQEARIAAQAARVDLARKEYKPDFDVSVQYTHRVDLPDLLTAQVTIPLRLQKSARQDQAVAEAVAELSALESDHHAAVNSVRARITTLLSDLERNRTQLALYVKAILPQSRGGVTSALASFQSGRASLLSVLDLQNTVFTYETSYYRSLSDFAKELAELEQLTGTPVLP